MFMCVVVDTRQRKMGIRENVLKKDNKKMFTVKLTIFVYLFYQLLPLLLPFNNMTFYLSKLKFMR